jgi:hypothetical protein
VSKLSRLKAVGFYLLLLVFARKYFLNAVDLIVVHEPVHRILPLNSSTSDPLLFDRDQWFRTWPSFQLNYPDHSVKVSYLDLSHAVGNFRAFEMFRHWMLLPSDLLGPGIKAYFCDPDFLHRLGNFTAPPTIEFSYANENPISHYQSLSVVCDGR